MGEAGVQKAGGKQQCAASLIKRKRGAASVIKESATREGCKEKVQEGKRKKRRLVAAAGRGAGGALLRVWDAPGRGDLPVSGGFLDGDPSSRSAPSLRCSSQGICSSTWAPDCEFRERSQWKIRRFALAPGTRHESQKLSCGGWWPKDLQGEEMARPSGRRVRCASVR